MLGHHSPIEGAMLLMVATGRLPGMHALPGAMDGLHGALVNLCAPDAKHRHHHPKTTHLDPTPPSRPWPLLGIYLAWTAPAWTRFCGWGRGRLGGWVCRRGMLPRPSSPTPLRRSRPPPPPPLAPTTPPSSPALPRPPFSS